MHFTYAYCEGTNVSSDIRVGKAFDPETVKCVLDKLTRPKRSVSVSIDSSGCRLGSADFYCLKDGKIEIEVLQDCNDDFAVIDIPLAKLVVDIIFEFSEGKAIRDMLNELPIEWI